MNYNDYNIKKGTKKLGQMYCIRKKTSSIHRNYENKLLKNQLD